MKKENIVCVKATEMQKHFDMSKTSWQVTPDEINSLPYLFVQREYAEEDCTFKQIIPYAVFVDSNSNVLAYKRAGSEKRLSDMWSVGIGGHVNDKDKCSTLFSTLLAGLLREVEEEIGIKLNPNDFFMAGMINEEETEIGHSHTGVVFKVTVNKTEFAFDKEISNPTWIKFEDVDSTKFELWSALAVEMIKPKRKVHITLVGGQPAPVYNGIIATKPDYVVYVHSSESENRVKVLKREITIPSEDILLDPLSPIKILEGVVGLAKKFTDDEVTVNISSGLKSWSHFFGVIFERCDNASVVYMDQNNVLWNYKTMKSYSGFHFDMDTLIRLYDNNIDDYRNLGEYTDDDYDCLQGIKKLRKKDYAEFTKLLATLSPEDARYLKNHKQGTFYSQDTDSFVEWEKSTATSIGFVHVGLDTMYKGFVEADFESEHITDLIFNTGWFEYEVANILSRWSKSREIRMNCRFAFKKGQKTNKGKDNDKNEVDIIVNTGTKLLFVECKTQIYNTTDVDKFRSVVKNYGGIANKGIFITESPMKNEAIEKCHEHGLLHYSLNDNHPNGVEDELFALLDKELYNINSK